MPVSALSAAKAICQMRNWKVSNLEIQKILYIAHMIHLGENGAPLIKERFEAWDYGPVVPSVYRKAKGFGSGPVRNVFHSVGEIPSEGSEMDALKQAVNMTGSMSAGRLVSITHWKDGAWYKAYRPNSIGVTIPNKLIAEEYESRRRSSAAA